MAAVGQSVSSPVGTASSQSDTYAGTDVAFETESNAVVDAGDQSQDVTANLTSGDSAENEADGRVVVTVDDGTKGTYPVVVDGQVSVNEEGNVAAKLGSDGKFVFRSYPDGRSEEDAQQEQLIADGTAAAEVYVTQTALESSEFAADVVTYSEATTAEVTQQSEGTIEMTAERSEEEGRVIITTGSEEAVWFGVRYPVTLAAATKALQRVRRRGRQRRQVR